MATHWVKSTRPNGPNFVGDELTVTTSEFEEAAKAAGHTLALDEDGEIDWFALESDDYESFGGHNGPKCTRCGETWCHHCETKAFGLESCDKLLKQRNAVSET